MTVCSKICMMGETLHLTLWTSTDFNTRTEWSIGKTLGKLLSVAYTTTDSAVQLFHQPWTAAVLATWRTYWDDEKYCRVFIVISVFRFVVIRYWVARDCFVNYLFILLEFFRCMNCYSAVWGKGLTKFWKHCSQKWQLLPAGRIISHYHFCYCFLNVNLMYFASSREESAPKSMIKLWQNSLYNEFAG